MATILNSAILDSAMLHKTLTQSNSIWLKLIHSDSTWWWQPSWILPSWIQTLPSWIQTPCYLLSDSLKNTLLIELHSDSDSNSFILTQLDDGSHLEFCHLGYQPCCTKLWFNLIQSDSKSFTLTQLDDGSHLEFWHLVFSHLHNLTSNSFILT